MKKKKIIEDEVVIKTSDQRRAALVRELQETYTKALMAVKTFEEREASGLEVDEIMLKKLSLPWRRHAKCWPL